jgi:hypothetical protein
VYYEVRLCKRCDVVVRGTTLYDVVRRCTPTRGFVPRGSTFYFEVRHFITRYDFVLGCATLHYEGRHYITDFVLPCITRSDFI